VTHGLLLHHVKPKKLFNWFGAGSDVTLMSLRVRHTF
jgi:hypothetical protein